MKIVSPKITEIVTKFQQYIDLIKWTNDDGHSAVLMNITIIQSERINGICHYEMKMYIVSEPYANVEFLEKENNDVILDRILNKINSWIDTVNNGKSVNYDELDDINPLSQI